MRGLKELQKSGKYPITDVRPIMHFSSPTPPPPKVRGKGLMVAVEFDSKKSGYAKKVTKTAASQHDLLLLTASAFEVLRFVPGLVVSAQEVGECLRRFEATLKTLKDKGE